MAARQGTLAVNGYRELLRAFQRADSDSRKELRSALKDVGEVVRRDATGLFSPVDPRSAAGYKTRVRQRGVAVEQSLRRTTGRHPEYGALQMRSALVPALTDNVDQVERQLERALDRVADHFNRDS
jgi:hypothetical protein